MEQLKTNSRRNFLSAMAILSSGSVLAGSPLNLWNNQRSIPNLKDYWHLLMSTYQGVDHMHEADHYAQATVQPVTGQRHKPGQMVAFPNQQLLALPTWIYWGNNNRQPDDVVITFFENVYPFKKVNSINRFELQALTQLTGDNNSLRALCNKTATGGKHRLNIKTHIAKKKTKQDVQLLAGNNIVSSQPLFYNI